MEKIFSTNKNTVKVKALFVGQSINLKALNNIECLATNPMVVSAGEGGCAVLFRYGVVVFFNLAPLEEVAFLNNLKPLVTQPFADPEIEDTEIHLESKSNGKVESGVILMSQFSLINYQIVADVLAKSVVLAYYEAQTASAFDRIEPFAIALQQNDWGGRQTRELLRQLGNTLSVKHKIVGRVEVIEKPELLWDYPDLERLYLRLEKEYEVRERHIVLDRKLELVFRTAETTLDLMQHNTNLRVEWYIVILIVVEILLSVYEMFFRS